MRCKKSNIWLAVVAAMSPLVCAAQAAPAAETMPAAAPVVAEKAAPEPSFKVYGRVDLGLVYDSASSSGKSVSLNEVSSNRLGFIGNRQLTDDLKGFFRLEHRFYLDTGEERSGDRFWTDKAWVGLESATFGSLAGGRVLTVGNTIVGGSDSEALSDSDGAVNNRKGRIENNLDNGLFYTSPYFGSDAKIRFLAHYGLPEGDAAEKPMGIGAQLRLGKLKWDAGFQRDPYKDGSEPTALDRKVNAVFMGGGYDFGSFELKGTMASSKGYLGTGEAGVTSGDNFDNSLYRLRSFSLSFNKNFGKWDLGVAASQVAETNASGVKQPGVTKVAAGYWYSWDKQTRFLPTIAYQLKSSSYESGVNGYGEDKDKRGQLVVEIGIRHEF